MKYIFWVLLASLTLQARQIYENPALNPVKFQKSTSGLPIELIKDGDLNFALVADLSGEKSHYKDRQSIRIAVEALQDAFERVSGKTPPLLTPESPELNQYPFWIVVGKNKITEQNNLKIEDLPPEGFTVKSFDRGIIIAGHDGALIKDSYNSMDWSRYRINGTANGAYDFIERFLGMRYYYPGIGVYAKELKNLTVQPVEYTDKPEFKNRYNWAHGQEFGKSWPWPELKNDGTSFDKPTRMAMSTRYEVGHSPEPLTLGEQFPELIDTIFFTDRSGYRYYTPASHIGCFFDVTNPKLADLLVTWSKKYYETNGKYNKPWGHRYPPNSEYIWFGPPDTYVSDMENERSKPFLFKERAGDRAGCNSDLFANFFIMLADKIKQELPGKKLGIIMYHSYTLPPLKVHDFPDNIRGTLCMGRYVFAKSKNTQKYWIDNFSGWTKILKHPVSAWLYGAQSTAFTKLIQGRYVKDYIKTLSPYLWRDGIFIDAGGLDWRFYPSYYLEQRTLWNSEFNNDAALNEHWNLLYGEKSGAKLKEFYDTIVNLWEEKYIPLAENNAGNAATPNVEPAILYKVFNNAVIDKLEKLLTEAKNSVPSGSIERKRVDFFATPWTKELQSARTYNNLTIPEYQVRKLSKKDVIKIDGILDEKSWSKAPAVEFADAKGATSQLCSNPQGKLQWDDSGIYIGFSAQGKVAVNPGDVFFKSDNVEFFFSPGTEKEQYYHFGFSPANDLHSGLKVLKPTEAAYTDKWQCRNLQFKAKYTNDLWSFEAFIPFESLKVTAPKPYTNAFMNFINNKIEPKEYSAFSLTMGNNHNYNIFGKIKFMGKGDL